MVRSRKKNVKTKNGNKARRAGLRSKRNTATSADGASATVVARRSPENPQNVQVAQKTGQPVMQMKGPGDKVDATKTTIGTSPAIVKDGPVSTPAPEPNSVRTEEPESNVQVSQNSGQPKMQTLK